MPPVRKGRLILPTAAAFVAVVLAAACSFDASKLRARQLAHSGDREADARNTDSTEADALLDHPVDKNLAVRDSFGEVAADRARAMSEVGDVAEAPGSLADAGDALADLPLGTGGAFDSGGAGGTGGVGGMPESDGGEATAGTGGSLDTAWAGGGDGGDTGGTTGSDGGATTAGTGGSLDTAGAGGTGGAGGVPASAGATATAGTGGSLDTGGVGGTGGAGGVSASAGATATAGTGGSLDTGGVGGTGGNGTGGTTGLAGATATGGTGGSVSLPAGLVGWWKMDEAAGSSTAVDASGNGNDATLTGLNPAAAWATGRTGGALKCDGSGAALVNDSASLDGITTGVTVSAWVNRLSATTGFAAVLSRETGTTNGQYYWVGVSGDKAEFYGLSGVLSNTTVPLGTWTHLAATHDGTTARIYINGSQVTSQNSSNVFKADTSKLTICGNQNGAGGTIMERWNGLVDDLQLYNRVLTATEIATLAK